VFARKKTQWHSNPSEDYDDTVSCGVVVVMGVVVVVVAVMVVMMVMTDVHKSCGALASNRSCMHNRW
jgi:ABC-type uncharacterized transport system YnjBCD permease subunit